MDEMNKQGLFVWLKALVESGTCPGVTWVDQAEGTFQIPWSNQKSRSWQKEDSSIFLKYAEHTCKYKPGEKMDFPKWKQNLKSAINKNRFIERLREHDHLSGPKPYRVYRFISEKHTRKTSDDSIPDLSKRLKNNEVLRQHHIAVIIADSATRNELLAAERSTSISSTYSESRSSSSPALSVFSDVNLPLSPDLPRNDIYGNIPIFVDNPDSFSGDEDHNAESSLPTTCHNTSENLSSFVEFIQTGQLKVRHSKQTIEKVRSLKISPESGQPHQRVVKDEPSASSLYREPYSSLGTDSGYFTNAPPSQDFSCPKSLEKSILSSGVAHNASLQYPTHAQKGSGSSVEVRMQSLAYPTPVQECITESGVYHNPSTAYPTSIHKNLAAGHINNTDSSTSVQNSILSARTGLTPAIPHNDLLPTSTNDRNLQLTQAGLNTASAFSNTSAGNITMVNNTQPVSFSELDISGGGGCSSDQPSSMDTLEEVLATGGRQQFANYRECSMSKVTQSHSSIPRPVEHVTEDSVMHLEVLYGTPHRTVKKVNIISSRSICRLFFGQVNTPFMQSAIKGEQNSEEIELPSVDKLDYEEKTKSTIRMILNEMELGIVISYRDGDIFVERRCLPRVYLSDGVSKTESLPRSTKKRYAETKAFDFNNNFREAIMLHKKNEGPVPKDHFFLTIGYQIIPNDDSPTRTVPVYVVVRHVQAAIERYNILGASTIAPNPMFSDPNSFDKTVQFFKAIDLKK